MQTQDCSIICSFYICKPVAIQKDRLNKKFNECILGKCTVPILKYKVQGMTRQLFLMLLFVCPNPYRENGHAVTYNLNRPIYCGNVHRCILIAERGKAERIRVVADIVDPSLLACFSYFISEYFHIAVIVLLYCGSPR